MLRNSTVLLSYVQRFLNPILLPTKILSATVGFLAIPDIPEAAQVAATIATYASLGSIIVEGFSIWTRRHQANTSTADSVRRNVILFS